MPLQDIMQKQNQKLSCLQNMGKGSHISSGIYRSPFLLYIIMLENSKFSLALTKSGVTKMYEVFEQTMKAQQEVF